MRIAFAIPILLLGACRVSEDEANNQITASFNREVAENTAEDVASAAENAAEDVANAAEDVVNRAENVDVDVDLNKADNRN